MAAIHAGLTCFIVRRIACSKELVFAEASDERGPAISALTEIPLLIIDDLGMRKLPASAAEDLLEIVMRRYERASTIIT